MAKEIGSSLARTVRSTEICFDMLEESLFNFYKDICCVPEQHCTKKDDDLRRCAFDVFKSIYCDVFSVSQMIDKSKAYSPEECVLARAVQAYCLTMSDSTYNSCRLLLVDPLEFMYTPPRTYRWCHIYASKMVFSYENLSDSHKLILDTARFRWRDACLTISEAMNMIYIGHTSGPVSLSGPSRMFLNSSGSRTRHSMDALKRFLFNLGIREGYEYTIHTEVLMTDMFDMRSRDHSLKEDIIRLEYILDHVMDETKPVVHFQRFDTIPITTYQVYERIKKCETTNERVAVLDDYIKPLKMRLHSNCSGKFTVNPQPHVTRDDCGFSYPGVKESILF